MTEPTHKRAEEAQAAELNAPPPSGESYEFPCSLVQRICWFMEHLSPGSAFNIAVRFVLTGPLDVAVLEEALREVTRRHEVLRTRFVVRDGEPKQLVEPESRFTLPMMDLRTLTPEERDTESEGLAVEEAQIGFDIEHGPLFRGRLLRIDEQRFILLLTIHHIVSDGWSIGIITDEMGQIYESLVTGKATSLAALPIQYSDYACWQQDWIASGELDRNLKELKGRLDQFTPLVIPTDLERPAPPSGQGKICSILLPRELTDSLQLFSGRQGCTMFVTMVTAFAILMHTVSRQEEVTLRTQTAGRSRVELEGLIGWLVNSIILRLGVTGEATFTDLIKSIGDTVLEAVDFQHVPFERLVEIVSAKKAPPRHPLFQVNFIFQRDFVRPWERAGVTMTPIPSKATGTFVDLNFFLVERKDGWRASVDVNTDVFRPETGEFFLRNYQTVLEAVARDAQIRVSQIALPPRPLPLASVRPKVEQFSKLEAAASGEVEQELLTWLRDALGVSEIGPEEDFFELGGNSLLALRLFARIKQVYHLDLGLATLFRARTMRALASVVRGGAEIASPYSSIVTIKTGGLKVPLYVIHGVGGNVLGFNDLARCLDRPVYGIQSQALDKDAPVLTRVEKIAAHYVHEIRQLQPEGPYCFLGFSFGGLVAYEMAQQLHAEGAELGLVCLIDTEQPGVTRAQTFLQRTMRVMKQAKIDCKAIVFGPEGLTHLRNRLRARALRIVYTLLTAVGRPVPQSLKNAYDINWFATVNYMPRVYPGKVVLIRAKDEFAHTTTEHDLGWGRLAAGGAQVIEIPGNHIEMFEDENVRIVARNIERSISDSVDAITVLVARNHETCIGNKEKE